MFAILYTTCNMYELQNAVRVYMTYNEHDIPARKKNTETKEIYSIQYHFTETYRECTKSLSNAYSLSPSLSCLLDLCCRLELYLIYISHALRIICIYVQFLYYYCCSTPFAVLTPSASFNDTCSYFLYCS